MRILASEVVNVSASLKSLPDNNVSSPNSVLGRDMVCGLYLV